MNLYGEVLAELRKQQADEQTISLVMAAFKGEDEVENVLAGGYVETGDLAGGDSEGHPSAVYLQEIAVTGFRGIGPESVLELDPRPGLTVVMGRNGSGKSSFAEGLEILLTGDNLRWANKKLQRNDGWRNLHHGSATQITARFQVEGVDGPSVVERSWSRANRFEDGGFTAQHHGHKRTDLAGFGWETPLSLYRPILTYNELDLTNKTRAELFDALSNVLGISPLNEATKVFARSRRSRKGHVEEEKKLYSRLFSALNSANSERADKVREELRKSRRYPERLATFASATNRGQEDLRCLMDIEVATAEEVSRVAQDLEFSHAALNHLSGTTVEQSQRLIRILQAALEFHQDHDEPCPVCGVGVLDEAWQTSAREQIDHFREQAESYTQAEVRLQEARERALSLVAVPSLIESDLVTTDRLLSAWSRWVVLPDELADLPGHLLAVHAEVVEEAKAVSEQARRQYSEQEEQWNTVLPDLLAWIDIARKAKKSEADISAIKRAERHLSKVTESLYGNRWLPIEREALRLWCKLRLTSNVDLRAVKLAKTGTSRRVDLSAEVDGAKSSALAVVSQGELGCLALSLFFPRAMLPDSPFRFLVIDDPIQAMDPARVYELAKVFSEIAQDRQLIVFTHDARLPEALRQMDLEYKRLDVARQDQSRVSVEVVHDPVSRYFRVARGLIKDENLSEDVAKQAVPGLCRSGLEAACGEAVRQKWISKGKSYEEMEESLQEATTLTAKVSLVLFDNPNQGNKVRETIHHKWGSNFAKRIRDVNRGSHGRYNGDLAKLINDCQGLAERLRHS